MNDPIYQTVIVGGGFTRLFTALHLAHQHYPRSVILIDKNDLRIHLPINKEHNCSPRSPDSETDNATTRLSGSVCWR